MKTEKIRGRLNAIIISLIVICFFLFMIFLAIKTNIPEELFEGNEASNFCGEICAEHGLVNSNNNSEYNFVRCQCATEISVESSYPQLQGNITTKVIYFDAKTKNKIPEYRILERIKR